MTTTTCPPAIAAPGETLRTETWVALAGEYLAGEPAPSGRWRLLAEHVGRQVFGRLDHYEHIDGTPWHPVPGQPYDGLEHMAASLSTDQRGLVSTDYCDHPLWSEDANLRFRIWHDSAHLHWGLGFDPDDELLLFGLQALELGKHARWALFVESVYQLAAYMVLGSYPDEQRTPSIGPVGKRVMGTLIDNATQYAWAR